MEKEYKIKSVEMVSPKHIIAEKIMNSTIEILEIPEGATKVPEDVFEGLETLKTVILPVSLITLSGMCFYNCQNLTVIEYKGTIEQWNLIYKGYAWADSIGTTEVICSDGIVNI